MARRDGSYRLTHELIASYGGGPVVCLDARAAGQTFRLHSRRPGLETNRIVRADIVTPDGGGLEVVPTEGEAGSAVVTVVTIEGPLESRAGYHDVCAGWSDGHDAIAERMCAALCDGDVVMVIDSPGGAVSGLESAVSKVLATKEQLGRRIYAYADSLIASAAYWWAASCADEIYLPRMGQVGSIGAMAAHMSVAGALEEAGMVPTFFAWPSPSKVAFAAELPLSDVGKERADRDVAIAGEAFAAAVIDGRKRAGVKLTRAAILKLDADCFTGDAAVVERLAEGVRSLDEVMNVAIAMAAEGPMATNAGESYEKTTKTTERYEADEEEEGRAEGEPEDEEEEEARAEGDDTPEEAASEEGGDEDEEEEEAARNARAKARTKAAARAPKSLAELAGLPAGSSMPAILGALIPVVGLARHAMRLTETRTPAEAKGALEALAVDAAAAGQLRTDLGAMKRRANARERTELLRKLVGAGVHTRGELFVDQVDDESGKTKTKPNPANPIAVSPLGTLRGYVTSKLKNRGAPPRSPFEPSEAAAKSASNSARVAQAASTPLIQKFAARSSASTEALAKSYAALEQSGAFTSNGV